MTRLASGCLCGGVRYQTQPGLLTLIRHCRNCQKQSGAAFSVNVIAPSEGVVIEGHMEIRAPASDRQFCPACGGALITRVDTHPELLIVKAGGLDGTPFPARRDIRGTVRPNSAAEAAESVAIAAPNSRFRL